MSALQLLDKKDLECSICLERFTECQLYMCGQCIKQHKMFPSLKDHPLYTLDQNEDGNEDGKEDWQRCPTHSDHMMEFYCRTCKKSGCKKCEHVLSCYQNKHDVIPMQTAVDEFNQNATEVKKTADKIKSKLKGTCDTISQNTSDFESQLRLCRTAIEIQEKKIIKEVQESCKALMEDLEKVYKENKEITDSQIKNIDSKLTEVNMMMTSIDKMKNKLEETETLGTYKTTINAVGLEVLGADFDQQFHNKNITPTFIPSTQLNDVLKEGIGKITDADSVFEIVKEDEPITVKERQPFVKNLSSQTKSDTCQLAATLRNSSAEKSATGVNFKVEPLGLIHTIGYIQHYKEHAKNNKVADVVLDTDGCLLVSSCSKDILKFNQSGLFVGRMHVSDDVRVSRMHQIGDGRMVYSDNLHNRVVMCDRKFRAIRSFGEDVLKCPRGLAVNKKSRILYVTDSEAHCVFKFNIDDGTLLGKIISNPQWKKPQDVCLTKEGHVLVADFGNDRIKMFDVHDKFRKMFVSNGREDGKVRGPCGVTKDAEENILVTSNHKLQLFDKNGIFIKRIDDKDDGLDTSAGICVISNRPRRVAVANHEANNVKIFRY